MTELTDACVEDLCAAIRASKTLKSLELRNNSLTDESVPALVQVMQESENMLEMRYAWLSWVKYKLLGSVCHRHVQLTFNYSFCLPTLSV